MRIITQQHITEDQVLEAHSYFVQFVEEFENIYYQCHVDPLHFCHPWIHTLLHTALEILHVGPGTYFRQFAMERTIVDLGEGIRQPSNPFGNLCQLALRTSQINALKTICPELDHKPQHPKSARNLGNGYIVLGPCSHYLSKLDLRVAWDLIHAECPLMKGVLPWGRLCLPNGQIARSLYAENQRKGRSMAKRISRNVKVLILVLVYFIVTNSPLI